MTLHPNHQTIIGDPQSAEGRANRQTFVGASEVACVLGEGYRGPYSVWHDKVWGADEEHRLIFDIGHALEPVAIAWARREGRVSEPVRNLPTILHPALRCPGANLDAAELDPEGRIVRVIEAKAWQRDDRSAVEQLAIDPAQVEPGKVSRAYIQMQTQMMCAQCDRGLLVALCGTEIVYADVTLDHAWSAYILHHVRAFWRYVETRTAPPALAEDLDALRKTPRRERTTTHDPDLAPVFARYVAARDAVSTQIDIKDRAAATLRQRLGECETLTAPGYQATRSRNDRLTVKETR